MTELVDTHEFTDLLILELGGMLRNDSKLTVHVVSREVQGEVLDRNGRQRQV